VILMLPWGVGDEDLDGEGECEDDFEGEGDEGDEGEEWKG
jgi:hypothetical protein